MGVKKILAQKYAGFISLDQVIGQMAKSSGTSYQDAATALCILWRDELDSPDWHIKDRLQGISKASSVERISATKTLIHIAEFGYPDDGLPF